jgi:hypothetical protein
MRLVNSVFTISYYFFLLRWFLICVFFLDVLYFIILYGASSLDSEYSMYLIFM